MMECLSVFALIVRVIGSVLVGVVLATAFSVKLEDRFGGHWGVYAGFGIVCVSGVLGFLISELQLLLLSWLVLALLFLVLPYLLLDQQSTVTRLWVGALGERLSWMTGRVRGKPAVPPNLPEKEMHQRAAQLVKAVDEALHHTPMSPEQKTRLRSQCHDIPDNVARGLQKLDRIRRIGDLVRSSDQPGGVEASSDLAELEEMEHRLIAEMNHSISVLMSVPVSLMKVELARDERSVQRIVDELGESNARMRDLAASYDELGRSAL